MSQEKSFIYLDNAATTPLHPEVFAAMEPWLTSEYANPSATYTLAHRARRALDDARDSIAAFLHCSPQELVFTAGGTESDNLAILGAMRAYKRADTSSVPHIITSAIEHPAVLEPCRILKKDGCELTELPVDHSGIIHVEKLQHTLTPNTAFVSLMMANNEIGTIQPIQEAVKMTKSYNPQILFHTDACQAAVALPINVQELGVDLLTLNASKIYGPKGVGVLYIKRGVRVEPLVYGGEQERALRPGTENVAGIVGFAKAVEILQRDHVAENARQQQLRDQLIAGILQSIPNTQLNGDAEQRLPNNVNILIRGIDGESLLFALDEHGIQASLGSACAAGSLDPSPVLLALGLSKDDARRSVRLTLGRETTEEHIQTVLQVLPSIIEKLRKL